MTPILMVVCAALVDAERRVLLQRRAPGRAMAGLWEFPGGKVEPGERPEAALARELAEELGILVDPASLAPAAFASADSPERTGRPMLLLLYVCRLWEGVPRPLDAAELKWLRPAEMDGAGMPPADIPLIARLEALI
ncbi:MAG: (deoxy)nucleoside triphosphate pyrophosphohydrolase [Alphaproteobacteria bacterium]|nr:(deoxy)nucleoside triphosphate pyrophosphohydrolase [Alphaproteobacteria bacterium]